MWQSFKKQLDFTKVDCTNILIKTIPTHVMINIASEAFPKFTTYIRSNIKLRRH